jgi:site-specific DNA-methyltransferase (adenine-specific)
MGTLSDLRSYVEPGAVVYLAECVELMGLTLPSCVDTIADPPYQLSGGEVTLKSGRIASVSAAKVTEPRGIRQRRHTTPTARPRLA